MNTYPKAKMPEQHDAHEHKSVMVEEVLLGLNLAANEPPKAGVFVDLTFGRGGHSRAILHRLSAKGRLFAIDRDPSATPYAEALSKADPRFSFETLRFSKLQEFCRRQDIVGKIDGLLMDLGVSSPQLDEGARGFSFKNQGPLDMRMDPTQGLSAADWINTAPETEIQEVLKTYGEERFYRRIARAIVESRLDTPITTTEQLAEIVSRANPAWEKHKHPATRAFQAIRIFINHELEELSRCLEQVIPVLAVNGRLVVISFHSLEDRIVKRFIQQKIPDQHPRGLPIQTHQYQEPLLRRLGKKQKPESREAAANRRARSAILRAAEKVAPEEAKTIKGNRIPGEGQK